VSCLMNRPFVPYAFLAAALVAGPLFAAARQGETTPPPQQGSGKEVVTRSGLRYTDLKLGEGEEAKAGNTVEVHYVGWLEDRTRFDASQNPEHPFTFRIGIDEVIQGWHEGITGMRVGGKRRLVVPPDLGYGKQGAGQVVPPNATLIFEVELLKVR
jgi:FKBP-type peptidyl-prolyl cis-trans isomerase